MRIKVIGAGPAGLYFAALMKRSRPDYDIAVFEQNPEDVTYGFGVVLSGRAFKFLRQGDPAFVDALEAAAETWNEQHISVNGAALAIDGSGFAGVERVRLLQLLKQSCQAVGIMVHYNTRVTDNELDDADLVVGADGANSVVRESHAEAFGTKRNDLQNYYSWFGVEMPFDAHTLTFVGDEQGVICGHHYRYRPNMSTFVPEVDENAWQSSGMYAMSDDERQAYIERVFKETLRGRTLVTNRSIWRRWRLVKNDRWFFKNRVLIGDALRTAHPSIGSGTRLAMEDSIALWAVLDKANGDVQTALANYQTTRQPIRDKIDTGADLSIAWFENVHEKIGMPIHDFVYNYLLRTGVMTAERLARECPKFMESYFQSRQDIRVVSR